MQMIRGFSSACRLLAGAVGVAVALGATPGQAQDAMARIKAAGKIVVATEAQLPPFEYVQDGKIVGYGKDILTYVTKDLGVQVQQLDLPWQGILPGLDARKFDLVATSVTIFPDRAMKYAFTMPIAEATHHLLLRKGDTSIKSADDLIGKRVGVQLGASSEKTANSLTEKWKAAGKANFTELKLYQTYPEAFLGLANGETDAVIASLPTLAMVIKQRPGIYQLGPRVTDTSYYAWVLRPDDADLRAYVNAKIKELRDKGELAKLQEKWLGFRMDLPENGYLPTGAK